MSAKHTPGPWWIAGRRTIRAGKDSWIGSVHWRNRDANARLIAAAPDLLEALQGILTANADGRNINAYLDAVEAARAAIAKAEASSS